MLELVLSLEQFLWVKPLLGPTLVSRRLNQSIKQERTEVLMGQMGKRKWMTQQYSSVWLVPVPALLTVAMGFLDIRAKKDFNKELKSYFRY